MRPFTPQIQVVCERFVMEQSCTMQVPSFTVLLILQLVPLLTSQHLHFGYSVMLKTDSEKVAFCKSKFSKVRGAFKSRLLILGK